MPVGFIQIVVGENRTKMEKPGSVRRIARGSLQRPDLGWQP